MSKQLRKRTKSKGEKKIGVEITNESPAEAHGKSESDNKSLQRNILIACGAAVLVIVVVIAFIFSNQASDGHREVATVNGVSITEYDIAFRIRQSVNFLLHEYIARWPDDLELDFEREFEAGVTFGRAVRQEAVRIAAMQKLFEEYANANGIVLTQSNFDSITDEVNTIINDMGEETFAQRLREDGIRDRDHFEEIFMEFDLMNLVIDSIIANPEAFAMFEMYLEDEATITEIPVAAKHILIGLQEFPSDEEAHDFAAEILERLQDGEDFDTLMHEYGQDPGMRQQPDGYTFMHGVMVDEFDSATRLLAVGEISGLVRSVFGYHIIKRVEPDMDNIMHPQGAEPLTLEQRQVNAVHEGFLTKLNNSTIIFNRALDDVPLERE